MLRIALLLYALLQFSLVNADSEENNVKLENTRPVIFFQPNTTQLFTELYQNYGLLNPPQRTFFEEALYLDQSIPPLTLPLQFSNQQIFNHANQILSEFHKRVNDLELYVDPNKSNTFFYTATGSKQLIVALVYGIVMSEPHKKFLFVEQAPFYSGHPNAVSGIFNYPNARFLAFHEPSEIVLEPGEVLVEFVTSPNNPDGKFRKPLTDAKIIIADFVFASSAFGDDGTGYTEKNIEWIKQARALDKHVFSFNSASKQFGKTGARCGYIWYPLYDSYAASIFAKFFSFISSSTVSAGSTGLKEFLDLIQAFLHMPDAGKALRQDANKSLIKRHNLVEKEILKHYPGSAVVSIAGSPTFFAKIKDSRILNKNASEVLLEDFDVSVNYGESMGESKEFIRLNLSGYSSFLVEFLNRLAGKTEYKIQDVLFTSAHECPHSIVCAKESSNTVYFVNPGDCFINADASIGKIEIILPPFISYNTNLVTIKKIDSSKNPVIIKAENFTLSLQKPKDSIQVQWTLRTNFNGFWQHLSE